MRFELGQKIIDKIRKPFIRVKWREKEREIDMKFKLKEFIDVYNNLLDDDYSKQTYLNVLQYRLNHNFGLASALQSPSREVIDKISVKDSDKIKVWGQQSELEQINLSALGFDLRCYSSPMSVYFITEQYSYQRDGVDIDIKNGDTVIDGGACYGDTALYFAHKVGEKGKVFSFEFLNENLSVFRKGLDLNPRLKDRIKILNNALHSDSNTDLYVYENGPGTFCSTEKIAWGGGSPYMIKTKSIDDLVKEEGLEKVDFIKMDIEGSELVALKGAKRTICQYKPNLAICIYHKIEDFYMIPKYIKQIVPEYKLYVKHHTDMEWETVLYASVR